MSQKTAPCIASVLAGLTLLIAAWVVATQPFAAPDEASHYLRALTIANGHLLGPKVRYHVPLSPAQLAWAQQGTRGVVVPAGLSPPDVACQSGKPDVGTGSCLEATEAGNYHPLPYLLPAVALSVSNTTATGLWLSRTASALPCIVFLGLAVVLLWSESAWSLIGLLLAVTPMVLFVASVVNPNGLEVASSISFAAAVLRISRAPTDVPTWVWTAFGLSGAVTILSWQLGPAFVAADILLLVALLGSGEGRRAVHDCHAARLAALALTAAAGLWLIYGLASGAEHSHLGVTPVFGSLRSGFTQLGPVLRDSVGTFGSLTVPLPNAIRWLWWGLGIILFVGGLTVSQRRQRIVLGATAVSALAFPVLFYAWVYRFSGFGLQGRYTLPIMVLIPLLSGELLYRYISSAALRLAPSARFAAASAIALVAMVQALAWFDDARVVAGARGTIRFYAHATWKPPLGWVPWIVCAALGTGSLLTLAVREATARSTVAPPRVHSLISRLRFSPWR
jgi:Predicted membrane protein (DUF2142)